MPTVRILPHQEEGWAVWILHPNEVIAAAKSSRKAEQLWWARANRLAPTVNGRVIRDCPGRIIAARHDLIKKAAVLIFCDDLD